MKELNLICFVMNLCIAVLMGALMPLLPVLTRKSFLFGVKILEEQQSCPEAKGMKKNYITLCLAGSAVLTALMVAQYLVVPDLTLTALCISRFYL